MDHAIRLTAQNYEGMLYKEALRTGFFEYQAMRDKYRELTANEGMHKELILRFIETQALILSPICPHVTEHVWNLIEKKGSILNAKWPTTQTPDEVLIRSSQYLMDAAHEFRLRLKTFTSLKGKKGAVALPKPTHGIIWVAKTFPPWQSAVLTLLKEQFQKHNALPDNKVIAAELKNMKEVQKYMKKVMPFVQSAKEKVEKQGLLALNLTLDFDETDILNENLIYLQNTLELEGLEIKSTDNTTDKIKEDCCPGLPFITYSTEPSVNLKFINPQPCSGHFEMVLGIHEGDTVPKVLARICKRDRSIKEPAKLKLMRYEDPNVGPRKIPVYNKPLDGKVEVSQTALFHIHLENGEIELAQNGKKIDIGRQLVYIVN